MNAFTVRRATPSDAAALAELAARTFSETFATENSAENLAAHLRLSFGVRQQTAEIEDPDVATLMAFRQDEAIGFAQVRRKAIPSCVVCELPVELHRIYLAQSVHGSGFAASLMRAAREAALELGGLHLWLGVWERNPRAIAFYLKSGFVRVGSHVFTVGTDRQTDLVFVYPLSAPATGAA